MTTCRYREFNEICPRDGDCVEHGLNRPAQGSGTLLSEEPRDTVPAPAVASTAVIDGDSAQRKALPLCSGVLDYFSAALVAIADVSRRGNDKHNPGQPLHWARGKSNDHADCIARHLLDRGTFDAEGVRHSASLAWRALALLQEELEREAGAPVSRGSR